MSADTHPHALELESLHAGEGSAEVARHAEACSVCRAHLEDLARDAAAFLAARDPDTFVGAVRVRADAAGDDAPRAAPSSAPSVFPARPRRPIVRRSVVASLSALALAAGVWTLIAHDRVDRDRLQARGGLQVAAIVLHDGKQTRQSGPITGAPGDSFRVEVALSAPAVLDAVVVDDRGRVVVLAQRRQLAAGTHYLESALSFDDQPTNARLIVGPAAAVHRAISEGAAPGVVVVTVRSGGRP
jgi:hypothetical protein